MTKLEELINELCPDGVEYKELFKIAEVLRGNRITKKDLSEKGKYPVMSGGTTFFGRYDDFNRNENTITIAQYGSAGFVSFITEKFWANDVCYSIIPLDGIVNKYLYYALTNVQDELYSMTTKAIPDCLPKERLNNIIIPVPPIEVQDEIVKILDNFTELTAELTARQKQYAFYRDYLLDFSNEDVTKKIPDIDCSNVEYKRLGDIATAIYRGAGIKRDEVTETGIPCVRYGEIYTTYNVTFNNCVSHTDEDKIQNKKYFEHGDVLFAITGESVEEIAKSCVYLGHDKCLAGGDIVVLKHNQNPKYMAYVLSTTNAQSQKSKGKVKSKVVHSSVPAISDIIIPIPPLAEQEKIANMIERFDHLCNDISNGLPAEIEARKKQYEYYRDTLLSFDDKTCSQIVKVERERELTRIKAIKWLKLKELAHYSTDRIDSSKLDENTYVGVDNLLQNRAGKKLAEHIPTSGRCTKYICNDILIGNIRPYLKKIWFTNNDGGTNGDVLDIRVNGYSVLYPRYLYYVLSSDKFFNYDMQNAKGAKMPRGSKDAVMNYPIPVPPLEEQERIVSILDRFDKLCNDISEGLPAEIEARQKQYEYYRDKLLMFKRVEANEK